MAALAQGTARDVKVIGVIGFAHLMSHFYFLVLPPILPLMKDDLGVSYAALGLIMTGYGISAGIAQTPVGFLIDRIGGRPALVVGMAAQGACIALMGFADAYWQLLVLYALAGAANTVYHPADYAILTAAIPKERIGRAYSIHLFSGNFGWAITPAVMVGLTALWGWHSAFVIVGLIGVLFSLFLWTQGRLLDDDIHMRERRIAAEKQKPASEMRSGGDVSEGIRLLFTLPIMMCFWFFIFVSLGFTGLRGFFVAAMDLLYSTPLAAANGALSGFLLGSALGILAGGMLADRIGPRMSIAAVTLVSAGVLVVLIGVMPMPLAVLIGVMSASGFLQGVLLPTRDLLVRSVTPDGSMGKVMGFLSSGTMLASGVVPVLFGWILDAFDPNWVFWISAVFISGALFTFVTAQERAPGGTAQERTPGEGN